MTRLKNLPGVKTNNLFAVPPAMLVEDEGFNIRLRNDEYELTIEEYTALFLAGHRPPPLIIWKRDDDLVLIDGHLRRRAALRAIERGAPADMTVDIVHFTGNDADREALMLRSGLKRGWRPEELAAGYKRLMGYWSDVKRVAEAVGKSESHVRDILTLATADTAVQDMVKAGGVTASAAIKVVRKEGHKAAAVLKEASDRVKAAGGTKVTNKHLSSAQGLDARTLRPLLLKLAEEVKGQVDPDSQADFSETQFSVAGSTLQPIFELLGER
ncbi:response regulator of citrate/malate metabolism [Azospirillum agricola]|uniref:ParB/RepB/Spo0J family partition protein n=1 Tax=Azospirillum agricola TaxID=1720247 RepID=UPI001AEA98A4|nr:hypothetical protein [Azospirillum agricola]MBP2232549.1 response regulator of citrate/malate metabolism [Azospirillum agricola]